ncbi:MAG: hypothetical protein JXR64_00005, partial [Spirochaetales bacterium]|nr:hypothetical protein [Spirochaetales bacterium]
SDKEDKKKKTLEVIYNDSGNILKKIHSDKIEEYVYYNNELICIVVTNLNSDPLYKIDYEYNEGLLTKETRVSSRGSIDDTITYHYNVDGYLSKKTSKTMSYEYIYNNSLLIEERWHSDTSLNQIIKYTYQDERLTGITHYSGEGVQGRRMEYKRERLGFISEEITYSASNMVISHFKFEYITTFKGNWLKRIKYTLHSQNKKKEASEVEYRDFKFFETETVESKIEIPAQSIQEESKTNELIFDNGIYKGEIVNGEMHGEGDFIFNTGTRYIGSFKNNIMDGKGKLTLISGKVYEGTFKNNMLEGPGACKWENGDFYAGEFKNGKMHGRGCYIWSNGNRFEGIFENNKRTEQGILYKKSELESTAPPEWVNELFKY